MNIWEPKKNVTKSGVWYSCMLCAYPLSPHASTSLSPPHPSCHHLTAHITTSPLMSPPHHSCHHLTTRVTTSPLMSPTHHSCHQLTTHVTTSPIMSPPHHSCHHYYMSGCHPVDSRHSSPPPGLLSWPPCINNRD